MKFILVSLAAMIGAACGAELSAQIQGVTPSEIYCTEAEELAVYQDCVEAVAVAKGVVSSRRLELQGDRELQTTNFCSGCGTGTYPRFHWCFRMCSTRRRLTVTDENVPTARSLHSLGDFHQAANVCLDSKIAEYPCLGNLEDLTIKVYHSE